MSPTTHLEFQIGDISGADVREAVPFSTLTTLEVGGPARFLVRCRTVKSVGVVLARARGAGLPVFVLGGGSNLLVSDEGFPGVVLQPAMQGITLRLTPDLATVKAGAGVEWDDLVALAVSNGLGGLECLSGIPGHVGAAPVQNIGAYGQDVAATLMSVDVTDRENGECRTLASLECGFGYRTSNFKACWQDRFVVTSVEFQLPRKDTARVEYRELRRHLESNGGSTTPSLIEIRHAVLDIRRAKAMLADKALVDGKSAGSFFLNPVVSESDADRIEAALRQKSRTGRPLPRFESSPGRVKLPAAYLIEEAGIDRGYVLGRAGISSRHALALTNRGGACAAEVVTLAMEVRAAVRERFGIELRAEPRLLGFDEKTEVALEAGRWYEHSNSG